MLRTLKDNRRGFNANSKQLKPFCNEKFRRINQSWRGERTAIVIGKSWIVKLNKAARNKRRKKIDSTHLIDDFCLARTIGKPQKCLAMKWRRKENDFIVAQLFSSIDVSLLVNRICVVKDWKIFYLLSEENNRSMKHEAGGRRRKLF